MTCGVAVSGPYCSQCGESTVHHDYSMAHFAEEVLESVAHVDGRLFSTFRSLFLRPGELAGDFLRGRRKRQFGPVQLFLVCNVLYFLLQPFSLFAPFTSTLRMQTENRPWSRLASGMVDGKVAARGVTREQYAEHFDEVAHLQGKSLVILMAPVFALGVWVLYGRVRPFYAEHLVFSFYAFAFILVWTGLVTVLSSQLFLVLLRSGAHVTGEQLDDAGTLLLAVPIGIYFGVAGRRVFGGGWVSAAAKAAALTLWLYGALTIYRFILFFSNYYAT